MMPNGDLEIAREYSCGCRVYRDEDGRDFDERGLFCEPQEHARKQLTAGDVEHVGKLF